MAANTLMNDASSVADATLRRRPGPFGPARILLPEGQKIESIPASESTASALERLSDTSYSQLPVTDSTNRVIGVFSWQSFGKRMSEIYSLRLDLSDLSVGDTDLEKPRFISPDTYIDTETDWKEIDYVLVGSPDNLIGVLTLSDIHARLNDFAEAFVLLFEIEHEIRDIFRAVYPEPELEKVLRKLSQGSAEPEARAAEGLQKLITGDAPLLTDETVVKPIQRAVQLLRKASQPRQIDGLADFTFAQYRSVIFHPQEWARFEEVFNAPKALLQVDFASINELRNVVFHFRRGITARDTDRLRRFRDGRRSDCELYNARVTARNESRGATAVRPR